MSAGGKQIRMSSQIVEITQPGYWLNKKRGFLEVRHSEKILGKVPLDDILAVVISVPGASISTVLLDEISKRNIPLVICGANFLPTSWTLPVVGYGRQFQVMQSQISLSEPRRKRVWQKIVRSKILNQSKVLNHFECHHTRLPILAKIVKSGDPTNCEAQAARIYWKELFGDDFRRNRNLTGINSALNYIYAVVRACVARGLATAGLHPSFSLHHRNPQNPINLVDDFIEPFRPFADLKVRSIIPKEMKELSPSLKAELVSVTNMLVLMENEHSPLSLACIKMARSFANYIMKESDGLLLPEVPKVFELSSDEDE